MEAQALQVQEAQQALAAVEERYSGHAELTEHLQSELAAKNQEVEVRSFRSYTYLTSGLIMYRAERARSGAYRSQVRFWFLRIVWMKYRNLCDLFQSLACFGLRTTVQQRLL